jgi:tetratricopeptide (TPR) repeat protein
MIGRMLLPALLLASAGPARAEERAPRAVYQQTLRGTAWLVAPVGKAPGKAAGTTNFHSGTAWVVSRPRKLLITSYHVVGARDTVMLLFPTYEGKRLITERNFYLKRISAGHVIRGKLLDLDTKRDLALIEAESLPPGTTELKLAAEAPEPGDRVHSVGNAAESKGQWAYGTGAVRQVYRTQDTIQAPIGLVSIDARVVETQLPVSPGDSGGPVVNDRGEVVGVHTAFRPKGQLLTFCVAAEEVRAFLQDAEKMLSPRTADDFNQRGVRAFQKGLWARAEADFTEALRLGPKRALFYQNRAWAFRRQGQGSRALADFSRAIRLEPRDAVLYNTRGFTHLEKGQLAEALADFEAAVRLGPKYPVAYNNRGMVRFRRGEYAAAIVDFSAAIKFDPKYAMAWGNRGVAHFKRGEHGAAIADYSVALRLNPNNPSAHHDRGLAYLEKGELGKAIADFTEVIRLQPQFADAYFHRSRAHAANKDPARAQADRARALELNPALGKK